ncbi:MAG: YfhO family protein [Candidatus Levybacteria bacterium]|nr:YfhO family protein [Candidatus Levybacteria bacterium]
MVEKIRKRFAVIFLISAIIIFYAPFFYSIFKQDLIIPLPADTIVGLYSPYRDFYSHFYPNGIPFKNFLITDPVRQTYVWKELVVDQWNRLQVPSWNPYEMAGKPLIGNFQSGAFYPLNLLLMFSFFPLAWSVFIVLQSLLAGFFTYLYLRNLKLSTISSAFGASAFTFSGFSISWLEWGNILHTAIWLPLILFSVDKVFAGNGKFKVGYLKNVDRSFIWFVAVTLSLSASFFGGHLQTFFYLFLVCIAYFALRWFQNRKSVQVITRFVLSICVFILLTSVQWLPTLRFIFLSARSVDQDFRQVEGWFIPYKHLIQFLVPDFFGNPATLNYWGTWNYGELTGFIGVVPLLFVLYSFFRRNSTVLFFGATVISGLLFATPNLISNLPYLFNIPFISSAQPTRILFLVTFSLSILSAYGVSFFFKKGKFRIVQLLPLVTVLLFFLSMWILVETKPIYLFDEAKNVLVSKRNLIFPTIIFAIASILITGILVIKKRIGKEIAIILLLLLTLFELLRFAQKFTPFVNSEYVFPHTDVVNFLKKDTEVFRVAVMDRRIMPPNFFTYYRIQTIEGYDPLYLKSYAEYIVALERNKPDVSLPYGFNRIITPHNYNSKLFDFLNVKYVLSFDELVQPNFVKVFQEGQTKVYENKRGYQRAFFVENVIESKNVIADLFQYDLSKTAVVEEPNSQQVNKYSVGIANIQKYSENSIIIKSSNNGPGFLVVSDAFYPTWSVFVDGVKGKIVKTNHAFRGVLVPKGNHTILFKDSLFNL